MATVTAHDGTVVTREMLDRWAEKADAGHLPGTPGPIHRGRPLSVGEEPAEPVTIRLDARRRLKLEQLARARHVSQAQVVRDLLDQAPLEA